MNALLLKSLHLQSSVLSPQHWPFDLEWIPKTAYLVGGCVRDALLEYASPYLDLDFVLPYHPIPVAQAIARHYRAGFVVLDGERQIARVVFENATADFALQVGDTLYEDLERRDFTVNAIAYSPHTQTLFDPLGGRQDLERRTLRMIAAANLRDDPLRLLRAYRQAAQLDFAIEESTRSQIYNLAPLLANVAAERIRSELSYLLSHAKGTDWLRQLWQDRLLSTAFVDASPEGLALIEAMDEAEVAVTARWVPLEAMLHRTLSDRPKSGEGVRRTLFATAKLMGLVSPDLSRAKQTLQAMKYSKAELHLVLLLRQGLTQLQTNRQTGSLSRRQQYLLFRLVREAFPALVVVAVASGLALDEVAPLVEEYLNPDSAIAHPVPLISGQALMETLALSPGPLVGQLLLAIEMAHAEGQIQTAAEAIAFAQQQVAIAHLTKTGYSGGN